MQTELQKMKQHIYEKRKPLDEFLGMLENKGFEIGEVEKKQFDYRFTDGTTMLKHYFIRLAFLDSWKKILPEEIHGFNWAAIQIGTAAGVCAVAEVILSNENKPQGFICQEQISFEAILKTPFGVYYQI